jgi:RHH-type transcriptional regulator, proline utilization regulon repressor / proline dehydrogenase / delta 1-pyrroline-5-carboxylate dehydrogenase
MTVSQRLPFPYRPEAEVVAHRLEVVRTGLDWADAARVAAPWVQAVRDNPPPFWAMESLLKEYPISSAEGLALMRLAEALLRVPDIETAIALTADQLGRADFDSAGDKVLARLSSAAIALSKHFLPVAAQTAHAAQAGSSASGLMGKMGAKTVVAATLRAVQLLGRQFVLGQDIAQAQQEADAARQSTRLTFSYDMLGEGARTADDAQRYFQSYKNAIKSIASKAINTPAIALNDGISIKLSALHPRYEDAHSQRVMDELVPRVWELCVAAAQAHISLTIDAEEVDRLELSLEVFEALVRRVAQEQPQWTGLGLAMQAYQLRALELVEHTIALARKHQVRLMCRLVKGAYWDAEIKRTQEMGLPHYPVFTHKHHTDVSYLACAQVLLQAPDAIYPQFATHNAATIAAILQMAAKQMAAKPMATHPAPGPGPRFELQRLHGMGEGVYREVLKNPLVACRVYAPVGAHRDLLAYLVRRLLENGANSSFVHQLADHTIGMQDLLISPLRLEPLPSLSLPVDLFGSHAKARKNSAGLDLTVPSMRAPLMAAWQNCTVPHVPLCALSAIPAAYASCAASYLAWSQRSVAARATVLRQAADAMQTQMPGLCAVLVKEAHKTWDDAIAEVREAVDLLRYYADEAERIMQVQPMPHIAFAPAQANNPQANNPAHPGNHSAYGVTGEANTLRLTARGVWVCISPWNFPLAIFVGQIAAALATGNTVLAKPAEQTPGVAQMATKLLYDAGVPAEALQLLHGPGETVGAALVAQPGVAGVVFTGSTQVAKIIQRALAAKDGPIIPLIAETGGINAMLVDSSALPEQVVDAAIQSAFGSAGQRCSALRVLVVHAALADTVLAMLRGAAQELVVGDPAQWFTDLGPVIDAEAFNTIQNQLQKLKNGQKMPLAGVFIAHDAIKTIANNIPNLITPQIVEVPRLADVRTEIFGPVLQVVRWEGDALDVVAQINQLGAGDANPMGYGLTLGIQTRIDSRAQALADAARVGNIYINRNMIGAVVGVQPFGGEGLSGTGPKAGGPHYLARFCAEKTVTVNTTAAGGNATLLARAH